MVKPWLPYHSMVLHIILEVRIITIWNSFVKRNLKCYCINYKTVKMRSGFLYTIIITVLIPFFLLDCQVIINWLIDSILYTFYWSFEYSKCEYNLFRNVQIHTLPYKLLTTTNSYPWLTIFFLEGFFGSIYLFILRNYYRFTILTMAKNFNNDIFSEFLSLIACGISPKLCTRKKRIICN